VIDIAGQEDGDRVVDVGGPRGLPSRLPVLPLR
jgi:hypothetical protein